MKESDDVWRRDEIESPCVKICVLHPREDICIGCFRTRREIAGWSRMTSEERRELMAELQSREPRVKGRRAGGRNGRLKK